MIVPVVRRAETGDVEALTELEREARAALVGVRGGDRWLADHPGVEGEWSAAIEQHVVLVGTIDKVVVAFLRGEVVDDLARVLMPYVHPDARELGFGDELLRQALAEFERRGAQTVDAEALPGDRETKNLYERAGIKARLIVLSCELSAMQRHIQQR